MNRLCSIAAIAGVSVALGLAPTTAHADAGLSDDVTVAMTVTGFDRAVAEANGYRIEVDARGREVSVPVTEAAQREEGRSGLVRTTVRGNCGSASLTTKPIAAKGGIAIATSYSLSGGRKSFGHLWKVTGQSRLGTPFTESFSGANNFDSSWSATRFRSLYGYSHGTNSLNLTNHAKLTNGGICTAKVVFNSW